MTRGKSERSVQEIKELIAGEEDILRPLIRAVLQEVLEAEMSQALGAEKGERIEGRRGYRSGYYVRSLITRVGRVELRVPQDRQGRFSSELFERYQRSEKALVGALAVLLLAMPVLIRRVIFARLDDDTDFHLCREHPRANDRGRISALFEWRGVGGQCLPPMARAFCAALSFSTRCRLIPRACNPGAIDVLRPRGFGGVPRE